MARVDRLSPTTGHGTPRPPPFALWITVAWLHLLVLGTWDLWGQAPGGGTPTAAPRAARQVAVALRPLAEAPLPSPEPATRTDREQPAQATADPDAPLQAAKPTSAPEATAQTEPASLTAPPGPGEAGDEYLPRSSLTRGPEPSAEVLLAYPEGAPEGHWQGVLTLFIDEHGAVQRVRVESSEVDLPPPFQEAARQAFLAARFTPGEWQGQPVRSRIRIAVEFEAGPAPGHSAAQR